MQIVQQVNVEPTFFNNGKEQRKKRYFDYQSENRSTTAAKLTFKASNFFW